MPEQLKQSDIDNKVDPSVARQWDNEADWETKKNDFYGICDGLKISMLGAVRPGVGVRFLPSLLAIVLMDCALLSQ